MEPDEMRTRRLPLDDATADRLAAGELHPSDAPPGFASVAAALSAARGGHEAVEPEGELLAAMVRAIDDSPSTNRTLRSMRSHLSLKIGALAGAALLSTAGAAAAATGNLPGPAQDAVAGVVRHVGVDLPKSDDHPEAPEHPENHGGDVSTVAHDTDPGPDHGATVSETARQGHGHDDTTTTSEPEANDDHGGRQATGPDDNPAVTNGHGHSGEDHPSTSTTLDDQTDPTVSTPATVEDHGGQGRGGSGRSGGSDDSTSGHHGSDG